MLDATYAIFIEKLRKNAALNDPVFDHVGNTGRGAQIVLQNQEFSLLVADDVDATDMGIDAARRHNADDLAPKVTPLVDQFRRNDTVFNDALIAVQVTQEKVQRPHPLLET